MFVGSQLRTPRHIHTEHGEGTDGVIKKGPKTRGRLVGTTEVFKAKTHLTATGEGTGCPDTRRIITRS